MKALRGGIPGQLEIATAPANWMLEQALEENSAADSVDIQVSSCHVAALLEGLQGSNDLVETNIGVEFGLCVSKHHD